MTHISNTWYIVKQILGNISFSNLADKLPVFNEDINDMVLNEKLLKRS